MSGHKVFLPLIASIFFFLQPAIGQTVKVTSIEIYGLKRTKEKVVTRELTFAVGDTINQLELGNVIDQNRNNLLNIGLFNEVLVNVSEWDTERDEIEIIIEVSESWYIYLLPILDLADRNFNVWWNTYDHQFNRLNLGAQIDFLNFSGHNDKLKAKLQFGYTPKQEIEYRFPYLGKKQRLGLTIGALHSNNKEVSYETSNNREQFLKLETHRLQERWQGHVRMQYRPSLNLRHELELSFEYLKMNDSILLYNPRYFRKGGISHAAVKARYSFEFDNRDLKIYPSKGIKARLEAEKIGWGKYDDENTLTSTLSLEWNMQLGQKFQYRLSGIGRYSLSRSQPSYIHYRALGFQQKFVRGYELYIDDGLDFAIGKYQLSYNFLKTKIYFGDLIPIEQFRSMPLEFYLSLHLETGYVHDPYTYELNSFANQWLYGGGVGFDMLLYHNFLFQLNFNTNHIGEWGFYIHNKTSF